MADVIFEEQHISHTLPVHSVSSIGIIGFLVRHKVVPNEKIAYIVLTVFIIGMCAISMSLFVYSVKTQRVNTQKNFVPALHTVNR